MTNLDSLIDSTPAEKIEDKGTNPENSNEAQEVISSEESFNNSIVEDLETKFGKYINVLKDAEGNKCFLVNREPVEQSEQAGNRRDKSSWFVHPKMGVHRIDWDGVRSMPTEAVNVDGLIKAIKYEEDVCKTDIRYKFDANINLNDLYLDVSKFLDWDKFLEKKPRYSEGIENIGCKVSKIDTREEGSNWATVMGKDFRAEKRIQQEIEKTK